MGRAVHGRCGWCLGRLRGSRGRSGVRSLFRRFSSARLRRGQGFGCPKGRRGRRDGRERCCCHPCRPQDPWAHPPKPDTGRACDDDRGHNHATKRGATSSVGRGGHLWTSRRRIPPTAGCGASLHAREGSVEGCRIQVNGRRAGLPSGVFHRPALTWGRFCCEALDQARTGGMILGATQGGLRAPLRAW